jgi:hypothetical protein
MLTNRYIINCHHFNAVVISPIGIASGFVVVYGLEAPAISNAFAALFGVRLNHTPMLPQRVLAALK